LESISLMIKALINRISLAGAADFGWILAITAASSLRWYSGWWDRSPYDSPDILAHQANAIELLRDGIIPYRRRSLS
jgi:hypothetical protein